MVSQTSYYTERDRNKNFSSPSSEARYRAKVAYLAFFIDPPALLKENIPIERDDPAFYVNAIYGDRDI